MSYCLIFLFHSHITKLVSLRLIHQGGRDAIMEELSCIGELNSLGIKTNGATTNDPDIRISSVRYFLNSMIDGQPAYLLSREGCPVLRKGFINGYVFKR